MTAAPITLTQWDAMHADLTRALNECAIGNEKRPASMLVGIMRGLAALPAGNPYLTAVTQHVLLACDCLEDECPGAAEAELRIARGQWDAYGMSLGPLA